MKLKHLWRACAVAAACMISIPASAQQSDPVTANYALYRAALERGDTAAAEAAAAAALSASQERDGEGGATATLAYNLALVRIDDGRAAEANEPAALALQITETNPSSGLDPLAARLVFGQAQLAVSPEQGAQTVRAALEQATDRQDVNDRAFRAAAALGSWALNAEQYELAQMAWAQAVAHSPGDAPADILARERARTAQAVAIIAQHARNPRAAARDDAYEMLSDTLDALYPFAIEQAPDGNLTPFQAAYAEALGWRGYGRAAYTPRERVNTRTIQGQPICGVRWSGNNAIQYTLQMAYRGGVGVAVFRILTNETGAITDIDIAYAAPAQDLSDSITPALARLNARRSSNSEDGCTMPRVHFQAVVFSSGL